MRGIEYILAKTFAESDARRAEQDARGIVRRCLVCRRPEALGEYSLCAEHASEQRAIQSEIFERA